MIIDAVLAFVEEMSECEKERGGVEICEEKVLRGKKRKEKKKRNLLQTSTSFMSESNSCEVEYYKHLFWQGRGRGRTGVNRVSSLNGDDPMANGS